MKISSYNITDVGYHYVGLRVLADELASREEQLQAISRGVFKYVSDRALRLMLPEPKGNFSTVGEKVCQELVHFQFARFEKGVYELTDSGKETLSLLNNRRFSELRRTMIYAHLATYDNLRGVVHRHMEVGSVWRGVIEADQFNTPDYLERLLTPTFGEKAGEKAAEIRAEGQLTPKKTEDAVNERVVDKLFTNYSYSLTLFRALCDRLVSLRLLNIRRASVHECEFAKSYSPCVLKDPPRPWYRKLDIPLSPYSTYTVLLSEPDMKDRATLNTVLAGMEDAFANLESKAGYYHLPDVRDHVCELLKLPEAAFDEGVNALLDESPPRLSAGLRYEGISARRKPLVRNNSSQIHNLIRRT